MRPPIRIKVTPITDKQLTEEYGNHKRYPVGTCMRIPAEPEHMYKQMDYHVLHIKSDIINSLHNSSLDKPGLEPMPTEEFDNQLRETIFNLGIYEQTKTIGFNHTKF